MNEQLVDAIVSAVNDMVRTHAYAFRDDGYDGTIDRESGSVIVSVMHKHIAPLLGEGHKKARIAALKAELAALEGKSDE